PDTASGRRLRTALVSTQIAVAMAVLVVAGLHVRSALAVIYHYPGFDVSRAAVVHLDPVLNIRSTAEINRVFDRARTIAATLPTVRRASITDALPLVGGGQVAALVSDGGTYGHRPNVLGRFIGASPGYLETLHIDLVAGRRFLDTDREGSGDVALVNETLAAK